jgi:hypothetical protein
MYSFLLKVLSVSAVLTFLSVGATAQIVWTDISADESLPTGVKLIKGEQTAPNLRIWYIEADMNEQSIIVHPYFSSTLKATTSLSADFGAIAAINAGYFGGSTSVSTLIEPGEVKSQNITALNRDGVVFPVTRSFFGINQDRSLTIDWIYHFSNTLDDVYRFDTPTPNTTTTPAPTPVKADGSPYEQLLMGAGGGPVIIKGGEVHITYDQEVFFGSGINGTGKEPRSAVGFTEDGRVIMMVVDGRQESSEGVTLQRLAEILLSLDVIEAINLDGGGSTTLAVNHKLVNRPTGGTTQRSVPTIISVVPSDSLNLPPEPLDEVILDTEFDEVSFFGEGWFQTANAGFYGTSPSWLNPPGNGSAYVEYKPELKAAKYEVFGWWVAAFNRTTNTPYIINHANGRDTVRVNQQLNSSSWVSLGKFTFSGTSDDRVTITDEATGGAYIVADAIRFVQLEETVSIAQNPNTQPSRTQLAQNYPNPFNPTTNIRFDLADASDVKITIYDLAGRSLQTVYSGFLPSGSHSVTFNGSGLASGTYMYILETSRGKDVRLMSLIK